MDSLSEQICETQDLSQVTYSAETRYTSLVLLEAVKASLEKAKPQCHAGGFGYTGGLPGEFSGHFVGNGWENHGTHEGADGGYQSCGVNT